MLNGRENARVQFKRRYLVDCVVEEGLGWAWLINRIGKSCESENNAQYLPCQSGF